jgi:hypothetical protein
MTISTKERIEARSVVAAPRKERRGGFGRFAWILGAVAVMAVVATAILYGVSGGESTGTVEVVTGQTADPLFTADELATIHLANQGLIPRQTVDWDMVQLKQLVNQGLIPAQALQPAPQAVEPLFSAEELATIHLANQGLIPRQTVDWDMVQLKQLVNQGLIPAQALQPAD